MTNIKLGLGLALTIAVLPQLAANAAVETTLTTVDDTTIRRSDATANPGTLETVLVKNDAGGSKDNDRNVWIEFDLSSVVGDVLTATFLIDLVNEGIGSDHAIRVGIVIDGDADENIDELTLDSTSPLWSDSNDEGVNFSKVIGGTEIGNFTISSSDEGDTISFSDPDLLAAIQNDTNNILTLVLYRTFNSTAADSFASKEHSTLNAPRLLITSTPEPSTYAVFGGLMLCFGIAGWWRRRRTTA